jgi:hypothetical protein
MTTLPIPDTPIATIMQAALLNSGGTPPPKKEAREYRYYHCHLDWNGLQCKKVDGPDTLPVNNNTQLLFVKSYFPESVDKHILKYKSIPDRVIIK